MNQLLALREFATDYFNLDPDRITALAGAGSNRQYFRILIVGMDYRHLVRRHPRE